MMGKIEYRYSIANIYTGSVVNFKEFKTIQEADEYRKLRSNPLSWKLVRRPILEWEDIPKEEEVK